MECELFKAQEARSAAEVALASGLASAENEAALLRQQLLSALQKARDAEVRAADYQERVQSIQTAQQVPSDVLHGNRNLVSALLSFV